MPGKDKRGAHKAQPAGGHQEASPLPMVLDQPGSDRPDRGRPASNVGAPAVGQARAGSQARVSSRTRGGDQELQRPEKGKPLLKNVDLGGWAYNIFGEFSTALMTRPGFGKNGKPATIQVNSYLVSKWPQSVVYQYDIMVNKGEDKRGLVRAAWFSRAIQSRLGNGFIWDGNKLGWSPRDFGDELRITVDLDAEKGQTSREGRSNVHVVKIAKAKNNKVDLSAIMNYLEGKGDFNNRVLEAINFMDHLLRETPSKNMINLRRSYFARESPDPWDKTVLSSGVEAMRGVYQTIRMAEGKRLVINVDVSHSTFWHETSLDMLAFQISGRSTQNEFINDCNTYHKDPSKGTKLITAFRRLKKNQFKVKHRGQTNADVNYTIKDIATKNAKTHTFDVYHKETGKTQTVSCFEYFQKRYGLYIAKWQLPLIETTKKGVLFPMELCWMNSGQRYPYKLNEHQTAGMIKFAVSRPAVRRGGIEKGLKVVDWAGDPFFKGYGLSINKDMIKTNARILEPPEVLFEKGVTAKPLYSGRWDLRGKRFFSPNSTGLKSWGIVVLKPDVDPRPAVTREQVELFKKNFLNLYKGHGGIIENHNPPVVTGVADHADAMYKCFNDAGNQTQYRPQMIIVIMSNKDAFTYSRIKKSMDCRFGVMSQCVQGSNVIKNAPQYCSNVLMKFNCKLGGTTSKLKSKTKFFNEPTMIIGADVSHAPVGLQQPSMAAISCSLDLECARYGAAVESNGHRVEMITEGNMKSMLLPFVTYWCENVGQGHVPKHIYYFRDGVSEGRYQEMIKQEVSDIKHVLMAMGQFHPGNAFKMTVIVAEKRHHTRFFPPTGPTADKNGNALPGTLVERDVTHPFENDFYLCSHVAIQGTARPTHYHVLQDEAKVPVDVLQALIYEHCYMYQRATTPVSIFPAIYYAHLASKRGEPHIDKPQWQKFLMEEERKLAGTGREGKSMSEEARKQMEWPKLQKFEPRNRMGLGMWYI